MYLHNRTLNTRPNWESPHQKLLAWLRKNASIKEVTGLLENSHVPSELHDIPDQTHLYTYSYKTYPFTSETLRHKEYNKEKVRTYTHPGYLVDYEARNIYKMWVPAKAEI